jgi:hypothetical protein
LMAGVDEVADHLPAHVAKADECDGERRLHVDIGRVHHSGELASDQRQATLLVYNQPP